MNHAHPPTCPTDVLLSEHRVIERVLACLAELAQGARDHDTFDAEGAASILEFLTEFADRIHHMKEEERLFPALESCGLPRDAGPTSVMRYEHEVGRTHVRAMSTDLEDAAAGRGPARERFVGHAFDFVTLLREHIAKEDQVLFPMADSMLPPITQAELLKAFAHDHAQFPEESGPASYRRMAEELCVRFGVTDVVAVSSRSPGCCSGARPAPALPVVEQPCCESEC